MESQSLKVLFVAHSKFLHDQRITILYPGSEYNLCEEGRPEGGETS
jgi:hypothetical protein